jgi:hypothetical protein
MPRRDAFSSLRQPESSPDGPPVPEKKVGAEAPLITTAKQPLDLIPVAARRTKRNRDWDRNHRDEKATYRGIPKRLQETVSDLAANLNVPRDELVRAFLEYSLSDLQSNRLVIAAYPKAQRMTLFPTGEASNVYSSKKEPSSAAAWLDQAFPSSGRGQSSAGKKKHGKAQNKKDRWESRATYRLPLALKEQVKAIAEDHDIPVGELVLYFLDHGLRDYQNGELRLSPSPRSSGKTLFLDE